jgi:guanylate cyclase
MLFDKPKHAPLWFAAYAALVLLSGFLEPYMKLTNNISEEKISLFFVFNLIGVGSLIFLMVYYFVGKKNLFQDRSEALLLNILPKEIVAILKEDHRTIAEHFDNASILFADIVNFTPLSSSMTPAELVGLLNEVFSKFDLLAEKYNLEKIKTIGDCYMVASGVPRSRTDHAQALVNMAIEMRDFVNKNDFLGRRLSFRFGINSGPVIAGVIGHKKFSYDLWGDSVNIASRMESQGKEGVIQISQSTYELIKDNFDCENQGTVDVKGKGDMSIWFVKS